MLPGMAMMGLADGSGGSGGSSGGGGGAAVSFIDRNPYGFDITPTDAVSTWQTTAAGADNSTGEASRTWLLLGAAADYELFAQLDSGPGVGSTMTAGTFGVWQPMNATLTYTVTRTSNIAHYNVASLSCKVRRASDSVELAAFAVTITAEVLP